VDVADLVHAGARHGGGALMRRWLAAPPVHFVALGALLFALDGWRAAPAREPARPQADARAASDAQLLEREARRLGLDRDDAVIQRRLLRNLRFLGEGGAGADYEEALALGLDRSDPVVRRRLVQRLELRAAAWARASEPSDAELLDLLARHPERYSLPARTRLSHVFLSRARRGSRLDAADRALERALAGRAPEAALGLGDPFLPGRDLAPRSEAELAAVFGPGFARAVSVLEPGRWSGPIESSYGRHRVFVHERTPARTARLREVRSALREGAFAERAEAVLADWLQRLQGEAG
jgi:hypothetical protein